MTTHEPMPEENIRDLLPSPDSPEFQIHQYFSKVLFDLLRFPDLREEPEEFYKLLDQRNIEFGLVKDSQAFAIVVKEDGASSPLLVVNASVIMKQMAMQQANPLLKEWADKFNGREYGNVITLEEAIELNKLGYALVIPNSDDQIHIYGIGEKANGLDDQTLEFGAYYGNEMDTACSYVPGSKDKFCDQDKVETLISAVDSIVEIFGEQSMPEVYSLETYLDSANGFVVECKGVNSYPVCIYEEGDVYGVGLLMEV
jgi:hypothetical protein